MENSFKMQQSLKLIDFVQDEIYPMEFLFIF